MQSDSYIAGFLLKAIAILAVLAALSTGWEVLTYYVINARFEGDLKSQVLILGSDEKYDAALQDAIYQDAQGKGLPIQRDDIQVEYSPFCTRVSVDYTVAADLGFCQLPLHFHPHYPQSKQTFPPVERGILGIVGFILGLYWFFKRVSIFREQRVIANTPLVPIRSIAMGRVQIHGRASRERTLLGPVSNQPYFFYKVDIDQFYPGRQGQRRWDPYLTDAGSVSFCLEGETGKVLVEPEGVELDLEQSYQCEISNLEIVPLDAPWRSDVPAARPPRVSTPDSELRRYVTRVAEGINSAAFQGADLVSSFEAGSRQRQGRRRPGRTVSILRGMLPLIQLDQLGGDAAPGDYRLTEYCVVSESEYDITGTCAMNHRGDNEVDRQQIPRGQNDKAFLISDKVEKTLEEDLRFRAWKRIVGGGLLAVAGTAVFLEAMGLLVQPNPLRHAAPAAADGIFVRNLDPAMRA